VRKGVKAARHDFQSPAACQWPAVQFAANWSMGLIVGSKADGAAASSGQ